MGNSAPVECCCWCSDNQVLHAHSFETMGNGQGNLSAEEQKAIQDATQLAGMYLRSSSHVLSKHPYLPIGKRPNEKQYFLVNHPQTKEDRLMVMVVRSEESPLALHVEANKALFTGFLEGLKHPYVLPMLEVDYLSERNMAVLFKPFSNKAGSLRDSIVKCARKTSERHEGATTKASKGCW